MSKRVVDSEVIRQLADETQRASDDIAAALARARRNVDQAPSWLWQRGRNWGKSNWDDVYRAVTNETTGWLFWSGGLRADAAALRELAQRAEVEAGVMGVLEQLVAIPAWLGTEVNNWLNPPPPGPSDAELKRRHDESVKAIAAAKERAKEAEKRAAEEKRQAFVSSKLADFMSGKKEGANGGWCVGYVKSYAVSLGSQYALDSFDLGKNAPLELLDAEGNNWTNTPYQQWAASPPCPAFNSHWQRIVGAADLRPGDIVFLKFDPYGHVGIITAIDGKSVHITDSNFGYDIKQPEKCFKIRIDAPLSPNDPKILGVMRPKA